MVFKWNMQSQIRRWPRQQSLITSSYNKLLVPTQNIFLSVCWFKLNCINLFYSSKNVMTTGTCIYIINLSPNKLNLKHFRWFEGGYLFCFIYKLSDVPCCCMLQVQKVCFIYISSCSFTFSFFFWHFRLLCVFGICLIDVFTHLKLCTLLFYL